MPVAVARPKRQVSSRSTGSHSIVDRAARVRRPRRRPSAQARDRSRSCARADVPNRPAPRAVSGSPASAAHMASTSWTMFGSIFSMPSCSGHSAGRIGVGQRALHADLEHLRREAVDVDAGDDQRARHRLRPSEAAAMRARRPSRPGSRCAGAAAVASKALRSAMCAQRDAIGVSMRRISDREEGAARSSATARRQGRDRPDQAGRRRAGRAARMVGIFDRRRRRLGQLLGVQLDDPGCALADSIRRADGAWCLRAGCWRRRRDGSRSCGCAGAAVLAGGAASCASAGSAIAIAAAAAQQAASSHWRGVHLNLDGAGSELRRRWLEKKNISPTISRTRTMRTITARGIGTRVCLAWNATAFAARPAPLYSPAGGKADRPSRSSDRSCRPDGRRQVDGRPPPGEAARPALHRHAMLRSRMPPATPPPKCSSDSARRISATVSGVWSPGWSTARSG